MGENISVQNAMKPSGVPFLGLWGHSTSIVQKILLVIGFLAMCVEISIPLLIVSPQFRLILGIGTIAYTVVTVISIVVVWRKTFRYMKKEIENLQERVSSAEEASFTSRAVIHDPPGSAVMIR